MPVRYLLDTNMARYVIKGSVPHVRERLMRTPMAEVGISVITEALQGTSYYQMVDYQKEVASIVRDNPNVAALMSTVGGAAAQTVGGVAGLYEYRDDRDV